MYMYMYMYKFASFGCIGKYSQAAKLSFLVSIYCSL